MSIGKRVAGAWRALIEDDAENAFFQICTAVEQTAKSEGRPSGRTGYKSWLTKNFELISLFSLGASVSGISIEIKDPKVKAVLESPYFKLTDDKITFEELIYHVIRCSLYHDAGINNDIIILSDGKLGTEIPGKLYLPKNLALGLVMAVVGSPVNAHDKEDRGLHFVWMGKTYFVHDWWGKGKALLRELQSRSRIMSSAPQDSK